MVKCSARIPRPPTHESRLVLIIPSARRWRIQFSVYLTILVPYTEHYRNFGWWVDWSEDIYPMDRKGVHLRGAFTWPMVIPQRFHSSNGLINLCDHIVRHRLRHHWPVITHFSLHHTSPEWLDQAIWRLRLTVNFKLWPLFAMDGNGELSQQIAFTFSAILTQLNLLHEAHLRTFKESSQFSLDRYKVLWSNVMLLWAYFVSYLSRPG